MRSILAFGIVALAIPLTGLAQSFEPLGVNGKLDYHVKQSVGPLAILGDAAYAGILQEADTPTEWGQGGSGYGKRFASTAACSGIHSTLAFGLDSALHEDPRYFRSAAGGFWHRAGHAFRGTILTHTDRGTETLSVWRFGNFGTSRSRARCRFRRRRQSPQMVHGGMPACQNSPRPCWLCCPASALLFTPARPWAALSCSSCRCRPP